MNTVLFDLDGTLLPMDLKEFNKNYKKTLAEFFEGKGYDSELMLKAFNSGIKAMFENDGFITNEEFFWKVIEKVYFHRDKKITARERLKLERAINKYYKTDFSITRFNTRPTSMAKDCIDKLKNKGYQIVIAANPLYPECAITECLNWAGIDEQDYIYVTTYENSCFTKPNLNYYRRLLKTIDKDPEDCIMVGNNVHEDMCAFKLGIDVFLLDGCLINEYNEDTLEYKRGGWREFCQFVDELPAVD
ncbi:MAG: HAD hydrolase-like protein [Lachnospiraceae bacterium]|nr:HAD hydrolase-like protein [Lachnospiraceae bacterium]